MTETARLVRELRKQGFTVEKTGGDHLKVYREGGGGCIYMALTPSDHRATRNAVARLRRMGFDDGREQRKKKHKRRRTEKGQ